MRSRLLTLLSLLVLLMQPITLLHGLAHQNGGQPRSGVTWSSSSHAVAADASSPADEAVCPQCLVLGALGLGVLPALVAVLALRLQHAVPPAIAALLRGGTSAGYHARGPPILH
ncbi:hypothetical protein [Aquabacterium sp.]|uniref:hypothetical protein n=1 Tax=Aquabacterium sp. TaxID=1872578 RepID=UPI002CB3989C|nr:hypothetical protein [Aquabacterium sp.]HSW08824.1 hypothetical protein [Aquabacterium sp.]